MHDSNDDRGRSAPGWVRRALLVAAIAICVLFMVGVAYSGTRHVLPDNDVVQVGEVELSPIWSTAERLPEGIGMTATRSFVTNVPVLEGDSLSYTRTVDQFTASISDSDGLHVLQFEPGPTVEIEPVEISRAVDNVFGSRVLEWTCRLSGNHSQRGEVYVSLSPYSRGDAGYSVEIDGRMVGEDRLVLTVIEQLWSDPARRLELVFTLGFEGRLEFVGGD